MVDAGGDEPHSIQHAATPDDQRFRWDVVIASLLDECRSRFGNLRISRHVGKTVALDGHALSVPFV